MHANWEHEELTVIMTKRAQSAVQAPLFSDMIIRFRISWFVLYWAHGKGCQSLSLVLIRDEKRNASRVDAGATGMQ
jgi:hypothetical protein